jgi:hypothetical protein
LLAAYTTTTGAKTAKLSLLVNGKVSSAGKTRKLSSSGQGVEDLSAQAADLTLNLPGSTQAIEERLVSGNLYLQLPPLARSQIPGNKPWAKIDLDALAQQKAGTNLLALEGGGSSNPTDILGSLEGVSDNAADVGTANVGGVSTTHYAATVDLSKAASRIGAKAGPKAANFFTELNSQLHTRTLPVDVWVDSQSRVRQLRFMFPLPTGTARSGGRSGNLTITLGLSEFGVPVQVSTPDADQVADVTQQVAQVLPAG